MLRKLILFKNVFNPDVCVNHIYITMIIKLQTLHKGHSHNYRLEFLIIAQVTSFIFMCEFCTFFI